MKLNSTQNLTLRNSTRLNSNFVLASWFGLVRVQLISSFNVLLFTLPWNLKEKDLVFFKVVRIVFSLSNKMSWEIVLRVEKFRKCNFWIDMQNFLALIDMSKMNEKHFRVIQVTFVKTQLNSNICKDQLNSFQPFTQVWGPNLTHFNSKVGSTRRVEP